MREPKPEDFAYTRLLPYCRIHWPQYQIAKFHSIIAHNLQEVEKGNITRLIISLPPRSGKTVLTAYFIGWYLGRNPTKEVIYTSYSQERADDVGLICRNLMLDEAHTRVFPGAGLAFDAKASRKFSTAQNGKFFATGWNSAVTGRGAHLFILDDMIKDRVDAESVLANRKRKDWFSSTAYTRLMPDDKVTGQKSAIVAIGTRWGYEDFLAYLQTDLDHENWKILSFPAICDEDDDALGREIGESWWPDAYSVQSLELKRKTLTSIDWAALYQQRPIPAEGGMLPLSWLKRFSLMKVLQMRDFLQAKKELPTTMQYFDQLTISVDCASKDNKIADYTAICVFGSDTRSKNHYLIDCIFKKVEFPALIRLIETTYEKYRSWQLGVPRVLIEDKSSGIAVIQQLKFKSMMPIIPVVPVKSKELRLEACLPYIESGCLWLPERSGWVHAVEEQIMQFPLGRNDDIVDAISQYLNYKFGKRLRKSKVTRYIR